MAKKKKVEEEKKVAEEKTEIVENKNKTTKPKEVKKVKTERRVTKKQPETNIRLYSLEELAQLFGVRTSQMRSLYLRRGLDVKTKLSYEEAYEKFNTIA